MAKEDLATLGYSSEAEVLREKASKGSEEGGAEEREKKKGAGARVGTSLRGDEFIGGVTVARQNCRNKFG